jgi:hypothetical protein
VSKSSSLTDQDDLGAGYSEPELQMMDQFAALYAFGNPIGRAVQLAGYGTSAVTKGFELLMIPYVQARVNLTREWIKDKLADNINTLLTQLDQDRAFAYLMDNPSAAVAATNSKAKLLGLLDPDKQNRIPSKVTIEWSSEDATDVKDIVYSEPRPLPN